MRPVRPTPCAFHLDYARRNGNTEAELIEAITHLAFYAGWPKAMSAMAVAKQVFGKGEIRSRAGRGRAVATRMEACRNP